MGCCYCDTSLWKSPDRHPDFLCLVVSGASWSVVPLSWAGGEAEHHWGSLWWRRAAHLMVTRKPERQGGMGMKLSSHHAPSDLFPSMEPHIHKIHEWGQSFQDPVTSLRPICCQSNLSTCTFVDILYLNSNIGYNFFSFSHEKTGSLLL